MITRITTSAIGIAIGITILFLINTPVFNIAVAAVAVIMLTELFSAVKCTENKLSCGICLVFAGLMPFFNYGNFGEYRLLFTALCAVLLFLSYIIKHHDITYEKVFFMISSSALVTYAINCLISLNKLSDEHGVAYVVLALCGAWIADSGAYFVGISLGKHKLCPEISPKKTVEGFIGGLLSNGIFFVLYCIVYTKYFTDGATVNYVIAFILGLVCACLGLIGDLTASLIKRQCKIKDYGNIMPGHGGLMDRFDSVLFVVPFMFVYLSYLNIFE